MQRLIPRTPLNGLRPTGQILDARSPSEFAYDHIPGAINAPVLNDAQRSEVGTLYKQVDPFEARKLGAVYTARNIATHLETTLQHLSLEQPLWVYCWRGGQRSGSLAIVLNEIGFRPQLIDGGYKQWRRDVLSRLPSTIASFDFRVVAGPTGSGKTDVLKALCSLGEQVIDLEGLCAHKGSLLGILPGEEQPSQPALESQLYARLSQFEPGKPVWVEDESPKLGRLTVPKALMEKINAAPHVYLEDSLERRQARVLADYAAWFEWPEALIERLSRLKARHSQPVIEQWRQWVRDGDYAPLVSALLTEHYDPTYRHRGQHHAHGQQHRLSTHCLSALETAEALRGLTLS